MVAFEHPALMALVERAGRRAIARSIRDPALRDRLTPRHKPGCKRILLSNDYYPALAQPNVEVLADAVAEVGAASLILASGRTLEVDAIIYGTGFAVHDYLGGMSITGRDGVRLAERWRQGAEAYLGTTIAGFPNLFTLMGPNTGLGHNSMVVMIEGQAATRCRRCGCCAPTPAPRSSRAPSARTPFDAWLSRRTATTVWASGCTSWYLDARGKNTTLWPGLATAFRARTLRLRLADYVLRLRRPEVRAAPARRRRADSRHAPERSG